MEKIRALIVDDEPLGRERLRCLLTSDPDIEIVGERSNGSDAILAVQETRCDLMFLDVQMPEMDGLEVVEALDPETMPVIIFVTAYDHYALRAFDVHALDYLLKPFDRERFEKALKRAKEHLSRTETAATSQQLLELLKEVKPERPPLERLVIKTSGKVYFLKTEEIDWIEASGNYLKLHVGSETHLIRETMSALENRLDPRRFCRIHRSTIVNLERIQELQPLFHGDYAVILHNGSQLTLSRTYRQRLPDELSRMI